MTEIIFSTPYTTKYTKAQKATKQTLFVSKYGVKEFNTVVSIETRTVYFDPSEPFARPLRTIATMK